MGKLKIAVLFGGCSEEHDISVKSATQIAGSMDTDKYDPCFIYVSKTGEWRFRRQPGDTGDSAECVPAIISPDKTDHGIIALEKGRYRKIRIDAVFPVIHGKMGEDGQIQGLLEMSGIPYVGCGIESSVLCMDKELAYLAARHAGVLTPEFFALQANDSAGANRLAYPVFVKPARSGSSFGVSKVHSAAELEEAVKTARRYDSKVLVEKAVPGREVGCAVLGNGEDLLTGELDMITLAQGFFKIHQEKNPEKGSENAVITVPADIPQETGEYIKAAAKKVYRALGCSGLARVDMFLQEDGAVVLNEVNTMPGCTPYSRYPGMMAAAGFSLSDVIDRVISLALTR
jgi:D-alanine--(R)-lactate ligase